MLSEVDISNVALAMTGAAPIVAFTDDSKSARLCKSLYPVSRDETFDLPTNWKFAKTRTQLAQLADEPAFGGFTFQYKLPPNARRIIKQVDVDSDDVEYRWKREVFYDGEKDFDVILSNEATCYIKYIRLRTDPAVYPGWFVKMIYLSMASKLSQPLKQDRSQALSFVRMWQVAVDEAIKANALEDVDVNAQNINIDLGNREVIDAAGIEEGVRQKRIIERT